MIKVYQGLVLALLLTATAFLLVACVDGGTMNRNLSENNRAQGDECEEDADCVTAGCSSQLCVPKDLKENNENGDLISTCEAYDYYQCYDLTGCGCSDGFCQWQENDDFNQCLLEKGGPNGSF